MLVVMVVLIVLIIISLVFLMRSVTKENDMDYETELSKLSDDAKLHYSTELLAFIDQLIEVEINNKIKGELIMNKPINIVNADDAVRDISNTVFHALDTGTFSEENGQTILNPKYIMTYITRRSLLMYLTYASKHNKSIVV